jgi:hypothetical protein
MRNSLPSIRYTVTPREELRHSIRGDTLLAEMLAQVWEVEIERGGYSYWEPEDFDAQAALAVLAELYEVQDSDPALFREILLASASSALELFDRWWTIKRSNYDEFILGDLSRVCDATVTQLPETGRPQVDYWLAQQKKRGGGKASPKTE